MSKTDRIIVKYVIYALPFLLITFAWGIIDYPQDAGANLSPILRKIWDVLGWIFIIWILASLYISIKMLFSKTLKDGILKKLAHIKDRDEREEIISGNAAKFSFLSTLALLFLFLFLSIMTARFTRDPKVELRNHHNTISLGMRFKLIDTEAYTKESTDDQGRIIINYSEFPLSKAALVLLLIAWQVGSYHYRARREGINS